MNSRPQTNRGVLLLGACLLGITVAFLALHILGPSDGTILEPDASVWNRGGIAVTPLEPQLSSGLRRGDIVVAVAGLSVQDWATLLLDPIAPRPHWQVGDVVTYTVLRGGHEIQVPVTLVPYDFGANLREEWGSLVFALAFALIAAFVFRRRPTDPAARALFLSTCCLLSAQTWSFGLQISDLVDATGFWLFQLTALGAYTLFWTSLLHFALLFPHQHRLTMRWRWVVPALYVGPAVYWVIYLIATRIASTDTLTRIGTWTPGQGITGIVYFAATLLIALDTFRTIRDPITSQQIRWVVFAGVLSGSTGLSLPLDLAGRCLWPCHHQR